MHAAAIQAQCLKARGKGAQRVAHLAAADNRAACVHSQGASVLISQAAQHATGSSNTNSTNTTDITTTYKYPTRPRRAG